MSAFWTLQLVASPVSATPSAVIDDLPFAQARSVKLHAAAAHEIAYTVPLFNEDGSYNLATGESLPFTTDVIAYRASNGNAPVAICRGRLSGYQRAVTEDGATLTINAVSYKALLQRTYIHTEDVAPGLSTAFLGTVTSTTISSSGELARNYPGGTDYAEIVWDLIYLAQHRTNGAMGLTQGAGYTAGHGSSGLSSTGATQFTAGTSLYDAITTLSAGTGTAETTIAGHATSVSQGFEWDINAQLGVDIWPQTVATLPNSNPITVGRGSISGYLLDWGGSVAGLTVSDDASHFANYLQMTATSLSTREIDNTDSTYGRYESVLGVTAANQFELDAQAFEQSFTLGEKAPTYSCVLTPDAWDEDFSLGDVLTLKVPGFAEDITDYQAVVDMDFAISDDGTEKLTVTLGAPNPNFVYRLRGWDQRISALERTANS